MNTINVFELLLRNNNDEISDFLAHNGKQKSYCPIIFKYTYNPLIFNHQIKKEN